LPFVPDGPDITEHDALRRKLNSGLSCEDIQIPLALVKPAQYVLFDVHGFCCTARGHGKRTVSGRKSSAPTCLLPSPQRSSAIGGSKPRPAATGERDDAILPIAGTSAGGFAGRRAGMVPLKFPRHFTVAQEPLLRLQGALGVRRMRRPCDKDWFCGEPTRINQR